MSDPRVLLSGLLSRTATYAVSVMTPEDRPPTAREIAALIKQLQLVHGWFEEEEREAVMEPDATPERGR